MLPWHVLMKINFRVDQRSTWVSDLTARWLWKLLRPSEQCLHWSSSAERHWIISLPNMLWDCVGYLDVLGYEETKLPISLQEVALL